MYFEKIKKFITKTIPWMLLTSKCRYCNELVEGGETLCEQCKKNLPVIKGEKCRFCGAEKTRCNCKKHKLGFEEITAPFYYENGIKTCIQQMKFNGKEFMAYNLARDMADSVKKDFGNVKFDFICFVPFTMSQKIRRTYNQSELLAENLSTMLKIPLKKVMVKLFDTNSQHKMDYGHRKGNIFGAYDVKNDVDLHGKTILLVDDVKTSGATLDDCAWILKIRGAEKVYCVVAAIAGSKKKDK